MELIIATCYSDLMQTNASHIQATSSPTPISYNSIESEELFYNLKIVSFSVTARDRFPSTSSTDDNESGTDGELERRRVSHGAHIVQPPVSNILFLNKYIYDKRVCIH